MFKFIFKMDWSFTNIYIIYTYIRILATFCVGCRLLIKRYTEPVPVGYSWEYDRVLVLHKCISP